MTLTLTMTMTLPLTMTMTHIGVYTDFVGPARLLAYTEGFNRGQ